jgi:hypothetical protein
MSQCLFCLCYQKPERDVAKTQMFFVSSVIIDISFSILALCSERSRHDIVDIDSLFCTLAQENCQSKERIRDA